MSNSAHSTSPASSGAAVAAVDQSSPYFLTNSDNPGITLVSQILTGDNFNTWFRSMSLALEAKNKFDFVSGLLPAPSVDNDLFALWRRCDSMVISWLLNSVSRDIASSVVYRPTSYEIWQDLVERFSQKNRPKIYQLKKSLSTLKQDAMSVTAYFTKFRSLWDELSSYKAIAMCSCGGCGQCTCNVLQNLRTEQQEELVMCFLMGLNDGYSTVREPILLTEPVPPMNKVFAQVLQQEKQREISARHSVTPMAMHSQSLDNVSGLENLSMVNSVHQSSRRFGSRSKLL